MGESDSVIEKICSHCKENKPVTEFNKNSRHWCKVCNKEYNSRYSKEYYSRPEIKEKQRERSKERNLRPEIKEKNRNQNLFRRYGITTDDYNRMYEEQEGKCAVCGGWKPLDGKKTNRLYVDHCHKTNKVRKLLCNSCNVWGGYLENLSEDQRIKFFLFFTSKKIQQKLMRLWGGNNAKKSSNRIRSLDGQQQCMGFYGEGLSNQMVQ